MKKFSEFELDPRLLRALSKLQLIKPTKIQFECIPMALEGKDILARAATGSGKTLAFCLPILQRLLSLKESESGDENTCFETSAIILAPTKELAHQISKQVENLSMYCSKTITSFDITKEDSFAMQQSFIAQKPDIIICTPGKLVEHLIVEGPNRLDASKLKFLVIDEADLIFSFGYKKDMDKALSFFPSSYQTFLMSATLTADLDQFKELVLKNPAIIDIKEGETLRARIKQTFMMVKEEKEKFLIVYVLLKLRLIKGKWIIFVNSVERGFKLKLFLEKFGIKSCILNSELPQKSRYHVVEEFNKGVYEFIIATDNSSSHEVDEDCKENEDVASSDSKKVEKKKKTFKSDEEFGVTRGIDFKNVAVVLNLDIPKSSRMYQHRIGRTGRGNSSGIALSLVSERDEVKYFDRIKEKQSELELSLEPFPFDMSLIDGFKYRSDSVFQSISKNNIKEARLLEIKQEILNCEKLKTHFTDKPKDLEALRHDKILSKDVPSHLKQIPDYILPPQLRKSSILNPISGSNPEPNELAPKKRKREDKYSHANNNKKRSNPLKSFKLRK